jgi:glycosyltransferase involved in cell wall biosynthesis
MESDRIRVLVVTAMYPTPDDPAYGAFVKAQVVALRDHGVHIDVLHLTSRSQKAAYAKGPIVLRSRLRNDRYDVVHAHYSYVGMVARTQRRVPVVVTFHGDDLLGTVGANGKVTPSSRLVVAAGKLLSRFVDAVIVQNQQMAALIPRSDVHIIPHEVDFDVFRPTARADARIVLGLDRDKRYLLFAANPSIPVKRFPLAREAAERLRRTDPNIELLVIHKEPQERLALYMSACDALVFPSYQEGSPNIVKQAMACNLPIVATDVGDVRDVIGKTEGCFVSAPTIEAFSTSLANVLTDRRRTNGREHIGRRDLREVAKPAANSRPRAVR